jgi:hypothetical protein
MHRCCLGFLAAEMAGAGILEHPNAKPLEDGHSMHSVGTARRELPADFAEERGL